MSKLNDVLEVLNTPVSEVFMTLWIRFQIRTIKFKVSVLQWQFDRIMNGLEKKIKKVV